MLLGTGFRGKDLDIGVGDNEAWLVCGPRHFSGGCFLMLTRLIFTQFASERRLGFKVRH